MVKVHSLFLIFIILILVVFSSFFLTQGFAFAWIKEGLVDLGDPSTNHNVNLPINTSYECSNKCNPLNICSLTGEQCTSDVDCYGCRPFIKPPSASYYQDIRGQNDAGKLTTEQTPTYSTLTTDMGTQASLYNELLIEPSPYVKGYNTWRNSFDVGNALFQKRYNPSLNTGGVVGKIGYSLPPGGISGYQLSYPARPTLSGEFVDDGPLAANAYLV